MKTPNLLPHSGKYLLQNMYSRKYDWYMCFWVPLLGKLPFSAPHMLSIVFVCTPVSGYLKWRLWFAVRWINLSSSMQFYTFQQSYIMVVPGFIQRSIICIRVLLSLLLSGQGTRKQSLVCLSISPNTHWPSTRLPLWFFLFPNFRKFRLYDCPHLFLYRKPPK